MFSQFSHLLNASYFEGKGEEEDEDRETVFRRAKLKFLFGFRFVNCLVVIPYPHSNLQHISSILKFKKMR